MNKEDVHAHPLYDYLTFRQIISFLKILCSLPGNLKFPNRLRTAGQAMSVRTSSSCLVYDKVHRLLIALENLGDDGAVHLLGQQTGNPYDGETAQHGDGTAVDGVDGIT